MIQPTLRRRRFLAAVSGALAIPAIAAERHRNLLTFIPQSDLSILDPIFTAAYVTRHHGMMVFDTLYGMDAAYQIQPQMADGHRVEDDGKTWLITLRDGLAWHDGEKVLARDCVASIRRWGARDSFGQTLMAVTDALDAPDDRTIRFRLKRPFPLLTAALGKPGSSICAMMPERLANTDPFKQVSEMVGSGPFRFIAKDRVPGSLIAYERNEAYVPRPSGTPASPPDRRSCISTASSGTSARRDHRRRRDAAPASATGGRRRPSICCRCCARPTTLTIPPPDPLGLHQRHPVQSDAKAVRQPGAAAGIARRGQPGRLHDRRRRDRPRELAHRRRLLLPVNRRWRATRAWTC